MIRLTVAIENPETRAHIEELLVVVAARIASQLSGQPCDIVDLGCEQQSLIGDLKNYFRQEPGRMAVLFSDRLTTSDSHCQASTLARACQAEFAEDALGTIAIMSHPRRVADIDRTIGPDCTDRTLDQLLKFVIERLEYLSVPVNQSQVKSCLITVRPLNAATDAEFRDYFSLRHHVYTLMGCLDPEVEDHSTLEVNEADAHAIHIGAFYLDGNYERLVGTTRVVTNGVATKALQEMLLALVGTDPIARQRLNTPYLLGLPIFQSHQGMNSIIREVCVQNQTCGELSRV